MQTPKRKQTKKKRRTHIPPLSPERLELMRNMLSQVPQIPNAARKQIEAVLQAASNPSGESAEAAIRSLDKERRRDVEQGQRELTARFASVGERGRRMLMMVSDAEWNTMDEDE